LVQKIKYSRGKEVKSMGIQVLLWILGIVTLLLFYLAGLGFTWGFADGHGWRETWTKLFIFGWPVSWPIYIFIRGICYAGRGLQRIIVVVGNWSYDKGYRLGRRSLRSLR
jgi:hypothetical protein